MNKNEKPKAKILNNDDLTEETIIKDSAQMFEHQTDTDNEIKELSDNVDVKDINNLSKDILGKK